MQRRAQTGDAAGRALPELVLEGGWPSVTVGAVEGTPEMLWDSVLALERRP